MRNHPSVRPLRLVALAVSAGLLSLSPAAAAPVTLGPLTLGATHQARVAHLHDQFREGALGDDTLLVLRTTLDARLAIEPLHAEVELVDSRAYLGDADTPINRGMVNPVEALQVNIGARFASDRALLRVGRMTYDIGSRRLVARNGFRNAINAFDGAAFDWRSVALEAHLFGFAPVSRLPDADDGLRANAMELDAPQFERWFFGGLARAPVGDDVAIEGLVFGLTEPAGRRLATVGLRAHRPPARGALDLDAEVFLQRGQAAPGIAHRALSTHLSLGYTVKARMRPRIVLSYDDASGDRDPSDAASNRFDPLYGIARPEFGPTGLYTAFTRRNLRTVGGRLQLRPARALAAFADVRAIWLDQARDAWTSARLQDPTGASGTHVGQQVELRIRWRAVPDRVAVEAGMAWLHQAAFVEAQRPGIGDPLLGYTQINLTL